MHKNWGRHFSLYSIATIMFLHMFGALIAMDAPRVAANEPTPWIGVAERINIFVAMLWILVLAIVLLRAKNGRRRRGRLAAAMPDEGAGRGVGEVRGGE